MRTDLFKTLIRHRGELTTRTTFMLCDQANDAVRWMLTEAGVNLRDVLDGLAREFQSESSSVSCIQEVLNTLLNEDEKCSELNVRKTVTLGKDTLALLNALARQHAINRDLLVNRLIMHSQNCLRIVMDEEKARKRHVIEYFEQWTQKGLDNVEHLGLLLDSDASLRDSLLNDLTKFKIIIEEAKHSIEPSNCNIEPLKKAPDAASDMPDNLHKNTYGNAQ